MTFTITVNGELPWYVIRDLEKIAEDLAKSCRTDLPKSKRRRARATATKTFTALLPNDSFELRFKKRSRECPACNSYHREFDDVARCFHRHVGGDVNLEYDVPGWRCVCGQTFDHRKKLDFHLRGVKDLRKHYEDNIEMAKLGFIGEK